MQPNTLRNVTPQIVEFDDALTGRDVDTIVKDARVEVVQTSRPVGPRTWERVSHIFDRRPDIRLRLYGFYGLTCDLSVVRYVRNVRRFAADCLRDVANVEHVALLENLEQLSIGIYNLESFDFLNHIEPGRLTDLSLMATRSKKPTIDSIARFGHIETLCLEGQKNGIEAVATLRRLRGITIRSITVPSLALLRDLEHLVSLDIKLGGTKNLDELCNFKTLRYLELWQISGLDDLSPIADAVALQCLHVQSLPRVTALPDLSRLVALRGIVLDTMKGLRDLKPIESAPALERFRHIAARGFEPQDYAAIIAMPTLKSLLVGTGSARKNQKISEMAKAAGIASGSGAEWQTLIREATAPKSIVPSVSLN